MWEPEVVEEERREGKGRGNRRAYENEREIGGEVFKEEEKEKKEGHNHFSSRRQ